MATQNIKTTIIPRKDTYANWTASTAKVLAAGEFGLDTTNNVLKCGDGTHNWADLPELNETTLSDLGITATAAEINKLDGLTATTAELNYVDGVTSAIQTQLNAKAQKSHASSSTTYGVATTSNYGHVKISNGDVNSVATANGLAAGMDHTHSNYVNQNAFSNVKVGDTTVAADTTTDTLELVAGSNVTITPDATNDKITISAKDTVYTHPSTHAASMITGLAAVATSGSYNDLSNKPTIPTNTNQTIKSGTTTFGANDAVEIVAGTNVTVTPDATNKKITISSTDTNTHKSHKINSGTKADGTTAITSASASSGDITLGDSGVTAGEYGPTSNQTPAYGATFNVPDIKVNSKGIVTSVTNRTVKIPASDNTDTKNTAGASNKTGTKLYLVGTTAQSTGTSYTNSNVYIGSDNKLYSNGQEVSTTSHTHSAYVKNTGDETITGVKTFDSGINVPVGSGTAAIGTDTFGGELLYVGPNTPVLVESSGDVVLIGINQDGNLVFNDVATPTSNGDAANKLYVDTEVAKKANASHTHTKSQITDFPTKLSQFTNDSGFTTNTGTVTSVKIAAGTGLSVDSTSAITTSGTRTLSLAASGVTADTYGPSADVTGTNGTTIKVPEITVDTYGRVTGVTERTYTSKDTNTHYTTGLYVGATNTKSNAATSNGGTYLKLYDDSTKRAEFKVTGEGATYVSSDTNGNITISSTNTTYSAATSSAAGLMSATDKSKLDGIASGANKYIHPTGTGSSKPSGLYKFSTDSGSHISGVTAVTKDDITALGIPAQDTTYSAATTSAAGLMSAADKTKLDGIATGATKVTTDTVSGWGYTKNAGTVTSVKVGSTSYSPSSGVVSLPAYPTVPTSLKSPYSLGIQVNSETSPFVSYDGSAAKILTIAPSTTAGAFTISDGSTTKTIQLAGKFTDTNTKVTQTQVSSSSYNKNYPLLMAANDVATTASKTTTVYKNYANLYANPYSGQLTAKSVVTSNMVQVYDSEYESGVTLGVGLNGWDEEGTISVKNVDSELIITGSGLFEYTDGDGNTYSAQLPSDNGTLALAEDIPTSMAWGSITGKPSSYTPSSHNQASSTITTMAGYSKPSSTSAISTSDTLNAAIGKLEKALDGKGTSNLTIGTTSTTAAAGNHTHKYAGSSSAGGAATSANKVNASLTIKLNSGSTEGTNLFTFNGSAAKAIDITPSAIGALATSAVDDSDTWNTTTTSKLPTKRSVAAYIDAETAPINHTHDYSNTYAAKSHTHSSYANQNAFSNVVVGSTTIAADTTTDTLTLVAGSNITLTPDATNDKVTIAATNTTYSKATSSALGLVKIGYTESGKNYPVELNSSGQMFVNVPWSDNNTTYTAGTGLTLSGTQFLNDGVLQIGSGTASSTPGTITVTDRNGDYEVAVKGLGSAAYTATSAYAAASHSHSGYLTSHQAIKQDGITGATSNRYASCTTAAGTAAKTASITTGTFSLETGARVSVKFSNKNTANNPTLNINGKGAKNIFHNGAQITSGTNKGMLYGVCDFVYDGTQWCLVGNYVNSTYSLSSFGVSATAAELNYVAGVTANIQSQLDGKASSSHTHSGYATSGHTHNYAGSSSAGGAATSANKVNKSLKVQLNGGTTEGTNQFTFDGSAAKTVNITPSAIGAAASSHTHSGYASSGQIERVEPAKVYATMSFTPGSSTQISGDGLTKVMAWYDTLANTTPSTAYPLLEVYLVSPTSGAGTVIANVTHIIDNVVMLEGTFMTSDTDGDRLLFKMTLSTTSATIVCTDRFSIIKDDSAYVKTTGAQTIAGVKTFNNEANFSQLNAESIKVYSDDTTNGVSNAVLELEEFDYDTDYYANGIAVRNVDEDTTYEYAFPDRSGVFSMKGHTHTVNIPVTFGTARIKEGSIASGNTVTLDANGVGISYCSYYRAYFDFGQISGDNPTITIKAYYGSSSYVSAVLNKSILDFIVPGFVAACNADAQGNCGEVLLVEKLGDNVFKVGTQLLTTSGQFSRLVVTYSDASGSGYIHPKEVFFLKSSDVITKTTGGSNY